MLMRFCHFEGSDEKSPWCVLKSYLNDFKTKIKGKIIIHVIHFFQFEGFWSETEPVPLTCQQKYRISFSLEKKKLFQIPCDRLIIQDLIQQLSNQKRTFILSLYDVPLYVSASIWSSSWKSLTKKYIMAASVKNVHMWSEKYSY